LLLMQLLYLFKEDGQLPEQPSLIYRKTIRLILKEWDNERSINRISNYSRFDPDIKIDYLSELAYLLTYKIKTKRFSEDHLIDCYSKMYNSYQLPEQDALLVTNEIESHSGIIVKSGHNHFEFSHLSLQEYLCANYLVREPYSDYIAVYVAEYPAPLAIATILASNASKWFASLILRPTVYSAFSHQTIIDFIFRLLLEVPYFKRDIYLGCSMLRIIFDHYK